ncbi:hypothetical protein F2Q69_00029584 [Brassica cretica]|uniref:Uncharacterized protein n=1 Tax=Brassica cretica TaxID=69181 RepID=A0A8S9S3X3_BRACR|nr:hypothetical protein F2Q69_00029584 [Brassica cretica]
MPPRHHRPLGHCWKKTSWRNLSGKSNSNRGFRLTPSLARKIRTRSLRAGGLTVGSKMVISKSTSKITFSRGNLLNTFSVKALKRKFQRKKNPGPIQFSERPSGTQHGFSLAVGRAGSTANSVRPFAELDQSRSANSRAGPKMDSARPFAELDLRRIQHGRSPSWTSPV